MLQQRTTMQNQLFRKKKFTTNATQACVPRQRTPKKKHFEYDQIKTKIFGFKDKATKPLKREKG